MKIKYNSIKVRNITESLEFYHEKLGLDIIDEYYSDTLSVVMLTDGYMKLELIESGGYEYGLDNLAFAVDDIEDAVKKLEECGVNFDKKAYLTSNIKIASLRDKDGVKINLIQED
ncbi:MAG: hypothetical protein BZ136_02435 [Methanosphaera sp. rholeuAM74]|nr:MAG: hypothetical protein BZ136_02435 [Methanosphaera sp. rholeuAM74]